MNTTHPADLAPLSIGPGLAFGLMLLLRRSPEAAGPNLNEAAPAAESSAPESTAVFRAGQPGRPRRSRTATASGRR